MSGGLKIGVQVPLMVSLSNHAVSLSNHER